MHNEAHSTHGSPKATAHAQQSNTEKQERLAGAVLCCLLARAVLRCLLVRAVLGCLLAGAVLRCLLAAAVLRCLGLC